MKRTAHDICALLASAACSLLIAALLCGGALSACSTPDTQAALTDASASIHPRVASHPSVNSDAQLNDDVHPREVGHRGSSPPATEITSDDLCGDRVTSLQPSREQLECHLYWRYIANIYPDLSSCLREIVAIRARRSRPPNRVTVEVWDRQSRLAMHDASFDVVITHLSDESLLTVASAMDSYRGGSDLIRSIESHIPRAPSWSYLDQPAIRNAHSGPRTAIPEGPRRTAVEHSSHRVRSSEPVVRPRRVIFLGDGAGVSISGATAIDIRVARGYLASQDRIEIHALSREALGVARRFLSFATASGHSARPPPRELVHIVLPLDEADFTIRTEGPSGNEMQRIRTAIGVPPPTLDHGIGGISRALREFDRQEEFRAIGLDPFRSQDLNLLQPVRLSAEAEQRQNERRIREQVERNMELRAARETRVMRARRSGMRVGM